MLPQTEKQVVPDVPVTGASELEELRDIVRMFETSQVHVYGIIQFMDDVALDAAGHSRRVQPPVLVWPQTMKLIPEPRASDARDNFESDLPEYAHCAACGPASHLDDTLWNECDCDVPLAQQEEEEEKEPKKELANPAFRMEVVQ